MKYLIILFLFLFVINIYITNHIDKKTEHYYTNRGHKSIKVYDISHKYLPNLSHYEYISNIFSFLFLISVILPKILIEFIGFIIPIFIIRLFTINLTILPKNKNCNINDNIKPFGGCYDKIFSGHFSVVLLITLLLLKHKYISLFWVVILNIINALLILMVRAHYTIDIVVSLFITLYIYQNNYTMLLL